MGYLRKEAKLDSAEKREGAMEALYLILSIIVVGLVVVFGVFGFGLGTRFRPPSEADGPGNAHPKTES